MKIYYHGEHSLRDRVVFWISDANDDLIRPSEAALCHITLPPLTTALCVVESSEK
jgi:hypothetical protein